MGISNIKSQSGAALILLMLGLVLFIASVFLTGIDKTSQTLKKERKTQRSLASAKELLINFALLSDQQSGSPGIGYLPCPDTNGDGLSNTPCGSLGESVEGWLPWQTLGSKVLKDGNAICLRYVVSGNYKIAPPSLLVKAPTPTEGHFVVHDQNNSILLGNVAADYALAVVFSPGQVITGQTRGLGAGVATICGSSALGAAVNLATNYLDASSNVDNANGTFVGPGIPGSSALPTSTPSVFIQAEKQIGFNDELIWVSPQDFNDVYVRMP
jgi:type II secretory pathway pseudopilin PulG